MKITRATTFVLLLLICSICVIDGLGSKFFKKLSTHGKRNRANLQIFGLSEQKIQPETKVDAIVDVSPSSYMQRVSSTSLQAIQTPTEGATTAEVGTSAEVAIDATSTTTPATSEVATTVETAVEPAEPATGTESAETAASVTTASETTTDVNTVASETAPEGTTTVTTTETTETAAVVNTENAENVETAATAATAEIAETAASTSETAASTSETSTTTTTASNESPAPAAQQIQPEATYEIVSEKVITLTEEHQVDVSNLTDAVISQIHELDAEIAEQIAVFEAAIAKVHEDLITNNENLTKASANFTKYVNRNTEEISDLIDTETSYVMGEIEAVDDNAFSEYEEISKDIADVYASRMDAKELIITGRLEDERQNLEEIEYEITQAKIQMPSPLSYCSVYPDCDSCTQSDKCVYCPFEKKCVEGDAFGPLNTVCRIFNYKVCTGRKCGGYTSCSECTAEPDCGWCALSSYGIKACLGRSSSYSGCPADSWVYSSGDNSDCSVLAADDQAVNETVLQAIEGRQTENLEKMNGTDTSADRTYYIAQERLQELVVEREETKNAIADLEAELAQIANERKDIEESSESSGLLEFVHKSHEHSAVRRLKKYPGRAD